MKVRWTEESLRLRITPSELQALQAGRPVRAALALPGGGWRIAVLPSATTTDLQMRDGEMQLTLTPADAERLADPTQEGVYFQRPGVPTLRFYIEKDFPCAHPRPAEALEPETETFPAPDKNACEEVAP